MEERDTMHPSICFSIYPCQSIAINFSFCNKPGLCLNIHESETWANHTLTNILKSWLFSGDVISSQHHQTCNTDQISAIIDSADSKWGRWQKNACKDCYETIQYSIAWVTVCTLWRSRCTHVYTWYRSHNYKHSVITLTLFRYLPFLAYLIWNWHHQKWWFPPESIPGPHAHQSLDHPCQATPSHLKPTPSKVVVPPRNQSRNPSHNNPLTTHAKPRLWRCPANDSIRV